MRILAPLTLEVERNRNAATRWSSFQVTNIFLNFSNDLAALARLFKGSRDCGDNAQDQTSQPDSFNLAQCNLVLCPVI